MPESTVCATTPITPNTPAIATIDDIIDPMSPTDAIFAKAFPILLNTGPIVNKAIPNAPSFLGSDSFDNNVNAVITPIRAPILATIVGISPDLAILDIALAINLTPAPITNRALAATSILLVFMSSIKPTKPNIAISITIRDPRPAARFSIFIPPKSFTFLVRIEIPAANITNPNPTLPIDVVSNLLSKATNPPIANNNTPIDETPSTRSCKGMFPSILTEADRISIATDKAIIALHTLDISFELLSKVISLSEIAINATINVINAETAPTPFNS